MNSLTRYVVALVAAAALLLGLVLVVSTANVGASDLTIPSYGVVRGAPGSTATVGSLDVPAQFQGQACEVELIGENNESTHPDNDLTVTTGSESYTFSDIESVAFGAGAVNGTMVLGGVVVLTLTFGEDGVTSGGYAVTFDCAEIPVTTTTTVPATTVPGTTPPPTLPPSTPVKNPPVTTPQYTG